MRLLRRGIYVKACLKNKSRCAAPEVVAIGDDEPDRAENYFSPRESTTALNQGLDPGGVGGAAGASVGAGDEVDGDGDSG